MTANNMEQLKSMLLKQIDKAMRVTSQKALADMYEETGKFYTGRKPKVYKRTGALGDTPRTTANKKVQKSSTQFEISFDAYLDQNYQYTSGDRPGMDKVLELANYGKPWTTKQYTYNSVVYGGVPAKPTVGKRGFWERAEKKIGKHFYQTVKKFL